MRLDDMERHIKGALVDHLSARVRAFVLNPLDRAELLHEISNDKHSVPIDAAGAQSLTIFGVEIRKSPWMPEGLAAVMDGKDQLVCVIRLGH